MFIWKKKKVFRGCCLVSRHEFTKEFWGLGGNHFEGSGSNIVHIWHDPSIIKQGSHDKKTTKQQQEGYGSISSSDKANMGSINAIKRSINLAKLEVLLSKKTKPTVENLLDELKVSESTLKGYLMAIKRRAKYQDGLWLGVSEKTEILELERKKREFYANTKFYDKDPSCGGVEISREEHLERMTGGE